MKVLKILFLVLMSFLLLMTLNIFQSSFALRNTVLSADSFKKAFAKSDFYNLSIDFVKTTMSPENSKDNKNSKQQNQPDIGKILVKSADQNWFNNETTTLTNGIFNYLDGKTNSLPAMNLTELKDKMISTATDEEMKTLGAPANYKEQVKNEVKKEIQLPDKVDLNNYFNTAPNSQGQIPLDNIKVIYQSIKNVPVLALAIALYIIIAIIVVVISPAGFTKWLGSTFLLSGLLELTFSKIPLNLSFLDSVNAPVKFLISEQLGSYRNFISREAIIVLAVGIILLVIGFIPFIKKLSLDLVSKMQNSIRYRAIKATRVVVAVLLTLLIPASIIIYSLPITNAANSINNNIYKQPQGAESVTKYITK